MDRSFRFARSVAAATLAIGALATALEAQATEQWYVTPSVGTASQRFGVGMSVKDDVMVCGAPFDDTSKTDGGAAFVYRFDATTSTWKFEQQLFPSDPETSAQFGTDVAVDGSVIVVGAPLKDTAKGVDAGQIYVFRYNSGTATWSEEQRLTSSVGAAGDQFGASVGVSGTAIVAGAPRSDTAHGADSGSATIFRYKNSIVKWVEEAQLIDANAAAGDYAGQAVAIDGSTVVVGSPFADQAAPLLYDVGAVNLWTVSGATWTEGQKLSASVIQQYAHFGASVGLHGDLLAIGAPLEDQNATVTDTGAAYIFRNASNTWSQEARVVDPNATISAQFGNSVAARGNLAIVGEMLGDVSGKYDCGSAFTFRKGTQSGWVLDQQLGASDFAGSDHFGSRVAMNDTQVLVSADGNDTASGADWGVVYGFNSNEITLSITPSNPAPGAPITFSAFRGDPGDPVMVVVQDVSGVPQFIPLIVYVFAADHTLTFTVNAPDPALGVSVGMRAWKASAAGPIIFSDMTFVDV